MTSMCSASEKDVTMDVYELIKKIEASPVELELKDVIRFETMNEFKLFLQALSENDSIEVLKCHGNLSFGISQDQWGQTIEAFGSLRKMRRLEFLKHQVPNVFSLHALSLAIRNAISLRELVVDDGVVVYGGRGDVDTFGESLRASKLVTFQWLARLRLRPDAQGPPSLNPILLALSQSAHLQKAHFTIDSRTRNPVSPDYWRALARSRSIRELSIQGDQALEWSVLADVLAEESCTLQALTLKCYQANPCDCLALVHSLSHNKSLQTISLQVNRGFTDDVGVELASTLKQNNTLEIIELLSGWTANAAQQAHFSAETYQALIDLLHHNQKIQVSLTTPQNLPKEIETTYQEFQIELNLNRIGRELLLSQMSDRRAWVNALALVNTMDEEFEGCALSCLFKCLESNPILCQKQNC